MVAAMMTTASEAAPVHAVVMHGRSVEGSTVGGDSGVGERADSNCGGGVGEWLVASWAP
jgi:hypothetical protein